MAKFKTSVAWAGTEFGYKPGDVIELPEEIARARAAAGLGSVEEESAAEQAQRPAVKPPSERTPEENAAIQHVNLTPPKPAAPVEPAPAPAPAPAKPVEPVTPVPVPPAPAATATAAPVAANPQVVKPKGIPKEPTA
jgi:hypothetical protein